MQSSHILSTLAQPQWLVPLFFLLWLAASAVLARVAGWRSLGRQFAASTVPSGQSFRFVSGSVGSVHLPVRYRHCLRAVVGEDGLYAAVMFPFSFQSPALFLPWADIESVAEKQLFFTRTVTLRVRGHWPVITLPGPVGQLAKDRFEASKGAG
jgi:hypothetical protein